MFNKRLLVFNAILVILAAALQVMPRMMGGIFAFTVILAGFPVYISARLHWALGTIVFLAAAYLTSIMDISETLFFICTNGMIGFSLGLMKERFKSIFIPPALSALTVILMLFAVNYLFDISIFGYTPQRTPLQQALILFAPLYIYCLIYLRLAVSTDRLIRKYIELGIH